MTAAVSCVRTIGEASTSVAGGTSPHSSSVIDCTSAAARAACSRPRSVSDGPTTDEPEYALLTVIGVSPCRTRTTVSGWASSNRTGPREASVLGAGGGAVAGSGVGAPDVARRRGASPDVASPDTSPAPRPLPPASRTTATRWSIASLASASAAPFSARGTQV